MQRVAFIELVQDRAETAAGRLDPLLADYADLFAPTVRTGLVAHLAQRLAAVVTPTVQLRFAAYCAAREPLSGDLPAEVQSHPLYPTFVQHMQHRGMAASLREFPVLADLLAMINQFWLEAATELFQRLRTDYRDIQQTFGSGDTLGPVVEIRAGLSDAHQQGRSVMCLTFASGIKLIYKPRNLDMETAWFDLLHWLNQRHGLLPLHILRVLPRHTYGWMEYAQEGACPDQAAVRRYYYRAGMLLCLLYLLQGTDIHHENILCVGEQPVLIDLECLFQPQSRWHSHPFSPVRFDETVLRTHFLPSWEGSPPEDASALGGKPPLLNGTAIVPAAYLAEVDAGFCQLYRFFLEQRDCLTGTDSPLTPMAGLYTRPIFRDTAVYYRLLQRSIQPELLRHAAERRLALVKLLTLQASAQIRAWVEPRYAAEIRAISQLDIPRFAAESDTTDLILPTGRRVADCFTIAPLEQVRQRLLRLSEADMAYQRHWMRGTMVLRQHALQEAYSYRQEPVSFILPNEPAPTGEATRTEWFIETALALAAQIQRMAVSTFDGSATWVIPRALDEDRYYTFRPGDYFLYDGNTGVALFLAAVEQICRPGRYHELIQSALAPLRREICECMLHPRTSIGGATGLGGLVYALVRIRSFLNEPGLLEPAQQIACLITAERIQRDRQFDIYDGAAGAILGLLSLYQATADPATLERARWCGEHLLNQRSDGDGDYRAWKTADGRMLSGMAHGAAGIAYSLSRLFAATGDSLFRDAAVEAMAFERTCFVPEAGNWRAFGSPSHCPVFWSNFCHGAAGIGLARLGYLAGLDTPTLRAEIATALHTILTCEVSSLDFLCCGNFGRYALLLEAGVRLNRSDLIQSAREKSAQVLRRSRKTGAFNLFADLPAVIWHPGFFQGVAGIGYALLRLACPGRLPCVLLWE